MPSGQGVSSSRIVGKEGRSSGHQPLDLRCGFCRDILLTWTSAKIFTQTCALSVSLSSNSCDGASFEHERTCCCAADRLGLAGSPRSGRTPIGSYGRWTLMLAVLTPERAS